MRSLPPTFVGANRIAKQVGIIAANTHTLTLVIESSDRTMLVSQTFAKCV
ncbi:hypothetical protein H6G76_29365 [Nostoc sp. FACHB-152]|nr:hypothetical protein [Nostoc sp. FACHB-152]MBD2451168.1 hypothetical protein [Nostoc sp. FACHB-152]MBD2472973.1 hypothetical protein [Nostoc sp. FACHB-145]